MNLVAGSTGVLGFEVCRRLRERGRPVRALVRRTSSPDRVNSLRRLGCEIATGDLKDRASLDVACAGVAVVISTVTAITTAKEGDSFAATDGVGTITLTDAARQAGVAHFIFVSFETEGMPDAPLVAAKRDAEHHLIESGLTFTILQPALFMESWLGPMLFADTAAATAKIYGGREVRFRYVAMTDVAEVAVRCIDHPAVRNAVIPFGGPESLSQRDAVRLFEAAFGKPFAVTEVPEDALEAQWKAAADPWTQSFSGLMLAVARGHAAGCELSREQFPFTMRTVTEFAQDLQRVAPL